MNLKTCFSVVFPEDVRQPEGTIEMVCWIRNSLKHCGQEESKKFQPLTLLRVGTSQTAGVKVAAQMKRRGATGSENWALQTVSSSQSSFGLCLWCPPFSSLAVSVLQSSLVSLSVHPTGGQVLSALSFESASCFLCPQILSYSVLSIKISIPVAIDA